MTLAVVIFGKEIHLHKKKKKNALTWASTDVSNHISFIPDEKIFFLNVQNEIVLKNNL